MPGSAICISLKGVTCRGKRRKITRSLCLLGLALCLESRDFSHLTLTGNPGRNTLVLPFWQRPLVHPMSVTPSFLGFTVGQYPLFLHDSTCGFRVICRPPAPNYVVMSWTAFFSPCPRPCQGRIRTQRQRRTMEGAWVPVGVTKQSFFLETQSNCDQERKKLLWD